MTDAFEPDAFEPEVRSPAHHPGQTDLPVEASEADALEQLETVEEHPEDERR